MLTMRSKACVKAANLDPNTSPVFLLARTVWGCRSFCIWALLLLLLFTGERSRADPLDAWSLRLPSTNGIFGVPIFPYSIVYGNDLFVVTGHLGSDYGTIYSSSDGL